MNDKPTVPTDRRSVVRRFLVAAMAATCVVGAAVTGVASASPVWGCAC